MKNLIKLIIALLIPSVAFATSTSTVTNGKYLVVDSSGNIAGKSGTVGTIAGLIAASTNVTITGSGTTGSPYSIAASGSGGGTNIAMSAINWYDAKNLAQGVNWYQVDLITKSQATKGTGAGGLSIYDSGGTNFTGLQAPSSVSSSGLYTMPATDGTTGQVLSTNGSKVLSWITGSGGSMVYPGAGIPNSTGSAWGTSYGTTGTGSVVLSASPTLSGIVSVNTGNATNITLSNSGTYSGYNAISLNGDTSNNQLFIGIVGGAANDNNLYLFASNTSSNGQIVFRPNGGSVNQDLFNVLGNLSLGGQSPTQKLSISGVISYVTNAPTLSSCGTSPTIVGNDAQGTITAGTGATGCTATFTATYSASAHCNITNQSMSVVNALSYTESTTNFVISQTGLGGNKLDYHCTFDN